MLGSTPPTPDMDSCLIWLLTWAIIVVQRTYIRSLHEILFPEAQEQPRPDLEAVATRLWSAIEHWPQEKVRGSASPLQGSGS